MGGNHVSDQGTRVEGSDGLRLQHPAQRDARVWADIRDRALAATVTFLRVDATYFSPHRIDSPARSRGCLTCTHFHGQFGSSTVGMCCASVTVHARSSV